MAGAGFVLFKHFPDGVRVLGLIGPEFHRVRCKGKFDIPKGVIDIGETAYQAAVREAEEEAGYIITPNAVVAGPFKDGVLTVWLAQVFDNPTIEANPNTGIIEHEGYEWLLPEELSSSCYNYLKPSIDWACKQFLPEQSNEK